MPDINPKATDFEDYRRAIRELCATFGSEYWRAIEERSEYPEAFVKALTDAGWLSALIPVEYGGGGLSVTEASVILEEINRSGANSGACHAQMYIMMDAFGFFDTEEEHNAVLREAARILTTGARLVLKVVNGGPILDAFRETEQEERDGVIISVSNTLSIDPPRMTQRISVSGPRGQGEYERRQRLYRVEELSVALEHAGFAIVGVFASPDRASFEPAVSSTIWIVGQRSGAG